MRDQWARTTSQTTAKRLSFAAISALSGLSTTVLAALGTNFFMGFVVVAGAVGLTRLAAHVSRSDPIVDAADSADGSAFDRVDVLRIWLPRTLTELARHPSRRQVMRSHENFRRFLEERHEENLWYAYIDRVYQRSGNHCDCAYVKHPYSDPFAFPELCYLLNGVAEDPPTFEAPSFANVTCSIIPDECLNQDGRVAVSRLFDDLYGQSDRLPTP